MSDNVATPEYETNHNIPVYFQKVLSELVESCVCTGEFFDNKPTDVQCHIKLVKDEQFYCAPRRLSYHRKEQVKDILDNLLEKNVIRPSQSPFCSPIVPIQKKNGELRICVSTTGN